VRVRHKSAISEGLDASDKSETYPNFLCSFQWSLLFFATPFYEKLLLENRGKLLKNGGLKRVPGAGAA
jgi:hypothetical protein